MQGYYAEKPSVKFTGKGVHYGKDVNITIVPMESGGIVFKRIDIPENNEIQALYSNVVASSLNTTITNGNVSVATVEHLMAGLFACQIKHAVILIDGAEVPLMDGGSSDFIFGLESISVPKQGSENLLLQKEVKVGLGDSYIIAKPFRHLKIDCTIDFHLPFIGKQTFVFDETKNSFKEEISHAKTFGHLAHIEKMQKEGICLGGDLYSAIIFDDEKILSPNFLYNKNDFVKHKILDFIGDISLSPYNIKAEFECYKPSHKLNNLLISKIFETASVN
jgi:UDP-3-O-[3-hydroxymyristoyl] N-acetylglucosamine deacetylase